MFTKIACILWILVGIKNIVFRKKIKKTAYLLCLMALLLCIVAIGKLAGI